MSVALLARRRVPRLPRTPHILVRFSILHPTTTTILTPCLQQMGKVNKNSTKAAAPSVPPGYVADPSHGPMLTYQSSLPKLPVPTLSSTISKYLETVRPHLTAQEYTSTESAARDFETSELGKELQSRLEARAKEEGRESWLSEWWNDAAYMGYRDPVVVFVSYFYVHAMQGEMGPAKRAAQLVKAMLPFRALVETCVLSSPYILYLSHICSEQLAPEAVKGAPLCMASYKWLFHASRYPVKPADTATKFDPATHDHVVFVRKNRFYEVSLKGKDGKEVSAADLEVYVFPPSFLYESDGYGWLMCAVCVGRCRGLSRRRIRRVWHRPLVRLRARTATSGQRYTNLPSTVHSASLTDAFS